MRFIYIDSHGKEVSIPTVDALALRIELGAITESTRLYDEAADLWAPASEHEIFRTLQRERDEKSGGFVAPPPPTMPPPVQRAAPAVPPAAPSAAPPAAPDKPSSPPAAAAPAPPRAAPRSRNPFDLLEGGPDVAPAGPAPPQAAKPPDPLGLGGLDFGLTLEAPPAEGRRSDRERDDEVSFTMGEIGPTFGHPEPPAAKPVPPPAPGRETKKPDAFDFQGFGGLLTEDEGDEEDAAPEPRAAPAADAGMIVEGVLEASGYDQPIVQGSAVVGGGLDLEQPLSDLPVDQQGWTPRERMRTETQEDESAFPDDRPQTVRPERLQRPRPAPRAAAATERRSPLPALIGALVVLAVVGGGGWFGWTRLKERRAAAAAAAAANPPVAIPAISAELEPRMRELADSTMADWLQALRTTLPAEKGVPAQPDGDWLAGSYLADASKYASIERYWTALGAYVDDLEAGEADSFSALYRARLDAAAVTGDDGKAMLDRAVAGFLAAAPERKVVYQQLRDVVRSALDLHAFLLANEENIEYDPAAGGASRDPVLEAVPSTPELKNDMWSRVDKITESLDALGALDKVTTERLLGLFTGKLQAIPIR